MPDGCKINCVLTPPNACSRKPILTPGCGAGPSIPQFLAVDIQPRNTHILSVGCAESGLPAATMWMLAAVLRRCCCTSKMMRHTSSSWRCMCSFESGKHA